MPADRIPPISTPEDLESAKAEGSVRAREVRIGVRLKQLRRQRDLTLKQVATAATCSESLLSKIENGKAYPSLSMLHRIAVALGANVSALLMSAGDEDAVVQSPEDRANYMVGDNGVRLERIIPYAESHLLQSHIHWIPPGAGLEGEITHEGEELGYVMKGEIELTVAGRNYRVPAGSSFHFRSERPHSYRNNTNTVACILWVSTPPTF